MIEDQTGDNTVVEKETKQRTVVTQEKTRGCMYRGSMVPFSGKVHLYSSRYFYVIFTLFFTLFLFIVIWRPNTKCICQGCKIRIRSYCVLQYQYVLIFKN